MGLIDCLGKVQGISAEAAKKMQKLHAERVKDGMSEEEVLRIERDIVLDHVNTLHEKMNTLRKKAKMKAVKYEKFDDTEAVGQVKAKYNKVEQPVKAEPTAKEAVAASADDRPAEAKRKEFLDQMNNKQVGDFALLKKLPSEKKGIKLDAIAKKINAAFSDGIITEDDYNTLADSVDHDYSVLKMDKTMQRVSGTIAAKTEVKVAEEKKPTVRKEKKKEPKLSRQERLNKLMDKAEEYNRERKQSVKAVLLNEMRIEAKKINVVVDAHKGFARIMLESGKKAQRRATETNKTEIEGFDPNTYSEQTQSIVDRFKDASAIREMLPDIIGTDGKSLSVDQKSAMLEALRSGKVTAAVKAMYDSFEAMLENGYIDVKENATGEVVGVPVDEYLSFFDQEAEVEDIAENEEILGGWKSVTDTAFEDINEILYETNNESDQGETGNTYAGGTENVQEEMGGENSARKTIEQQNIEDQLEVAMEELSAARSAFESKRAQLDKGLMQDQENLFGERNTPQDLLFDERASASARNEAIVPFKERVERAKREVEFLQKKLDEVSGMPTSQTSFDDALPKLGSYSGPVAGDMTNPERLSDLTTALNEAAIFYGKVPSMQRAIAFIRNIVAKNKNIRIDTAVRNFDKGEYRGVKIDPSALGYSFPDGTVIINFDKIGNNADMLYSTVLHELNHAAVRNEINTNAAFREELNGVLAGLREAFGVPNHEALVRAMYRRGLIDADLYGLASEHELLAELFSNEGFYNMLKGIEYKGENLLEKFFRIVAAWFSKKYKMIRDAKSGITDNNLADYLMTLTERVVTGEASSVNDGALAMENATANSGAFNPNDNRIYASQRIYKEDSDINESDIITSAAAMIESGGSIDDAIDAAVEARQYQTYSDKFSKRELKKIIKARFKELGIIDGGKKINYKKLIQSFIKKPNVSGIRGAFMRATKNMKKGAAEVRLNQKFLLDYLRENGVELSKKRMERVVSIIVGASKIVNQSDVLYKSLSEIDKVIQDQISEDNELRYEEGIKSFSEKIKTQFRERFIREKAMNKGAANQAALTRDLIGMATLYFKVTGVDLSKNRIVSLLNQIKKLSTSNSPFEVFNDISDMMDAIVLQQTNSDNLINCKNALKKIRKVSKGSNIQDVDRNFLRGLQFPTAAKVLRLMGAKSLSDYMNILNEVSKAYSTKQGIRLMSKARVIWFIETLNKRLIEKEQELISKRLEYAKKSGDVPEGTTIEEYMVMIHDSSKNSQNKSYKDTISGIIKDLQDALLDSYEENSSVAKELKSLDISNMDMDGLKKLNNILNNILNDEDFDGSEAILAKYKDANENLKKLEDPKNALKVRPLNSSSGMLTGKVANLKTFTNFISSLFYDDASRAKFRSILFGLLDKTLSNSKKEIDATAKEVTKLYAKHKLKLESDFRLSVYAFLNQHLGDPDTSFADRLDKLITDGVEKLYSESAARTNSIRKKDQLQQATETAFALKSMGLIEDFQISENKRFITVKRIDGLTSGSLNGVLSAGEQELYDYAQSKFNSIVDGVERTARNVYGLDFVRWQNYFPMIPKKMSDDDRATGDEEVQDQFEIYGDMDKKISKQPSDRLKNRGKLAANDKYYQMGFLDGFLNGYNQALISSSAGRHLVALANTANSDKFGKFLSGAMNEQIDGIKDNFDENKKIFREKLSEVVRDKLQAPFMFRSHQDWGRRMVSGFMNHVVRTWLARADQFVLQYAPNWMATATEVGVPSTTRATAIQIASIYDKDMRASYEKFLSNFSGQFRASMGMEAFDEQLKRFDDSSITYTAGKVLDTLNIVGISALKFADKGANNVSLIAAYINYLVKIGELKSVSDFDIETAADNLNPEAMAYAEQIAGRVNNESDKANRAHVTKNHEGSPFTFMWLLKGYSLNAYQEGMSSLKVAFSNRATGKQKAEGLRHFSTYMTQIVVFNGLKALAISPALNLLSQSLLPVLFGVAPDEESENEKKQRQQKRFARVAANVLSDATLAGVPEPVEEAAKEGANMLFKAAQGLMKDGKKDNKGVMDPRFSPYFAGSGALGGGAMLVDGGKTIHKAFTEETNNIYPYDVNQALDKLDYAQLAALVMRNGDMWRLTNSLEQELMKKRRTGGGSGLPKLPTLPKLNLPKIGR